MPEKLDESQIHALYDEDYVERLAAKSARRLQRLVDLFDLRSDDVVADFGCGHGLLSGLIHDRVKEYHGVDFSEEFIDLARRRSARDGIGNAVFEAADIVEFCGRHPCTFDKAFTMDFSEHVYDDVFLRLYGAMRDSLKPGGELFLHTPDGDYFLEILKKKGVVKQFPQHIAVRNAEENRALLEKCGFSQARVRHLPHYNPLLAWTHGFSFLPGVGRFFGARLFIHCRK